MNNPPDVSPTEHETEHYAHEVSKHVRGYLWSARPCCFHRADVALSYVHLGSQKANVAVALLVATFKAGLVAIFSCTFRRKKLIYRILVFTAIFVLGLFWLTFLAWYDPVVH